MTIHLQALNSIRDGETRLEILKSVEFLSSNKFTLDELAKYLDEFEVNWGLNARKALELAFEEYGVSTLTRLRIFP